MPDMHEEKQPRARHARHAAEPKPVDTQLNADVSSVSEHASRSAARAARVAAAMENKAEVQRPAADVRASKADKAEVAVPRERRAQASTAAPREQRVQAAAAVPRERRTQQRSADTPIAQSKAVESRSVASAGQRAQQPAKNPNLKKEAQSAANVRPDASREVIAAQYAQKRKKRSKWSIVFYIALIVLIGSLIALGVIWFSYFQGQQKYSRIADEAAFTTSDIEQTELRRLTVDWDALRAVNEDTVAWVYIPGTAINYPIVQGPDNDYYLTRDFDGDQGWLANYGTVFLDYRNNPEFHDTVSFVYGHNMNDGSMFADIVKLTDQAKFDSTRTVYLLTPEKNYKLRTAMLIHCDAYDPIVQINFPSDKDRIAYMQSTLDKAVATASDAPKPEEMWRVFAFSTCDDTYTSSGRYLLYCTVEEEAASGLMGTISFNNSSDAGLVDSISAASTQPSASASAAAAAGTSASAPASPSTASASR